EENSWEIETLHARPVDDQPFEQCSPDSYKCTGQVESQGSDQYHSLPARQRHCMVQAKTGTEEAKVRQSRPNPAKGTGDENENDGAACATYCRRDLEPYRKQGIRCPDRLARRKRVRERSHS